MACGTPVVSSNSSSLPEFGGRAARYFDPYDVEAMSSIIQNVWADDELRSANAQIEWALREALRNAGRLPRAADPEDRDKS